MVAELNKRMESNNATLAQASFSNLLFDRMVSQLGGIDPAGVIRLSRNAVCKD
jgi:hypothetical protein